MLLIHDNGDGGDLDWVDCDDTCSAYADDADHADDEGYVQLQCGQGES